MCWSKRRSIINSLIASLGIIKRFEYFDKNYNYKTSRAILGLYQINQRIKQQNQLEIIVIIVIKPILKESHLI